MELVVERNTQREMGRAEGSCLLTRLSFLTFCLLLPFSLPSEVARVQSPGGRLIDGYTSQG